MEDDHEKSSFFGGQNMSAIEFWSLGVDAIGDDDDLSHIYLPNFKQL